MLLRFKIAYGESVRFKWDDKSKEDYESKEDL